MITLRDYQGRGVESLRESFMNGHRRVCYVLPTGGGKTVVASYMVEGAASRGKAVLFAAHRIELIDQISAALSEFGIRHGIIAQGRSGTSHPVQVGMIKTVLNRARKGKIQHAPSFIIVDEAHHATAKTYVELLDLYPNAHVIGLTATPARTDGAGLKAVFQDLVIGPTIRELIDAGHLTPYTLLCPPTQIDLAGVRVSKGDFATGELAKRVDKSSVTGDAVDHYRKHAAGETFCAFCVSREHAAHVADQFTMAGFPTRAIDGSMNRGERSEILAALRSGAIAGVTSCDLISEGFDLPKISAAIMLRPTQSLIIYLQQIGRALRLAPGKDRAIILDHAGNVWRHGLPDMEREWTLEGRKKRKADEIEDGISIKQCRSCFAAFPATLAECPHCKDRGVSAGAPRVVEERDGELIEVTEAIRRRDRLRDLSYREVMQEVRTVADLVEVQNARGYKKGWALGRAQDMLGMSFEEAARALGYSEVFIRGKTTGDWGRAA